MLFSALFFNLALPFCLLPGFSPICSIGQIDTSVLLNPVSFQTIPLSKPVRLLSVVDPIITPSPALSPKPTVIPTPASVQTPVPVLVVTPKPTPVSTPVPIPSPAQVPPAPIATPVPVPVAVSSDSFIEQINNYRRSQGLSPVRTDPYTCSFAKTRAQEIVNNFNHDGFNNRISSKTLPYPSYSKVTENLAMNMDAGDVVNRWINSPGHAANLRADTPYVCVQSSGNYYAYEGWKP